MKRILILCGGGMKGFPAALAAEELRTLAGGNLASKVDLVYGTSVGGIIAALVAGNVLGNWTDFFTQDGPKIFDKGMLGCLNIGGTGSIYSGDKLDTALQGRFGKRSLRDCQTNLGITGFDAQSRKPFFTKSWNPVNLPLNVATPLWQPASWTARAPHYFEGFVLADNIIWDGGLVANNPAQCADTDVDKLFGRDADRKFLVLGCGATTPTPDNVDVVDPSLLAVVKLLTGMLFDAAAEDVDYQMTSDYGDNYRVVQPVFNRPVALDGADPQSLAWLNEAAVAMVAAHRADFDWFLS